MPEQRFEGAFAMMDVLGFRHRMESAANLDEVRDVVVAGVVTAALDAEALVNHERRFGPYRGKIGVAFFSDTVILWLPTDGQKPEIALTSIIYACKTVIATGMWLNVPLRGAVAYGDCLVSSDPVFYLGKPILEAHALETAQNWAGAVLCESARARVAAWEDGVVPWKVPTKGAPEGENMSAIDWPSASLGPSTKVTDKLSGQTVDGPIPEWARCFPGEDPKVVSMREATARFFVERHQAGTSGGAKVAPDVRERVHLWRSRYGER